jgi:hypothetical protein
MLNQLYCLWVKGALEEMEYLLVCFFLVFKQVEDDLDVQFTVRPYNFKVTEIAAPEPNAFWPSRGKNTFSIWIGNDLIGLFRIKLGGYYGSFAEGGGNHDLQPHELLDCCKTFTLGLKHKREIALKKEWGATVCLIQEMLPCFSAKVAHTEFEEGMDLRFPSVMFAEKFMLFCTSNQYLHSTWKMIPRKVGGGSEYQITVWRKK